MAQKKKKPSHTLAVEVLQNGEIIDGFSVPFYGHKTIKLSSKKDGSLAVPDYPFETTYQLIKSIGKGKSLLLIPMDWEGYFTSLGTVHDINSSHTSTLKYEIGLDDFGCLTFRDLKFLYKVRRAPLKKRVDNVKKTKDYNASLFSLLKKDKFETSSLIGAIFISLFLWGCFVLGLLNRPFDFPDSYADLDPEYVLPFLAADHIRHIPEALQKNLNRKNYIESTLNYYDSFSRMILGSKIERESLLFPNSMAKHRAQINEQEDSILQKKIDQGKLDDQTAASKGIAAMQIPSVAGLPILFSLERLVSHISTYHIGLDKNLKERRQFKKEFTNDPAYDLTLHNNIKRVSDRPGFGDISITGNEDDESFMYKTSEKLATKAHAAKTYIDSKKEVYDLDPKRLMPAIQIPAGLKIATFVTPSGYHVEDQKIKNLSASKSITRTKKVAKEPLTGVLDPALVSKTINRRKFELQLCYELALRRNQNTLGKMEFSWRIDSWGAISELRLLKSTIRDRKMIRCVQRKIAAWRFPRPRQGSVKIKYPFSFKPRRG